MKKNWLASIGEGALIAVLVWLLAFAYHLVKIPYEDALELANLRSVNEKLRESNGTLIAKSQERDKLQNELDSYKGELAKLKEESKQLKADRKYQTVTLKPHLMISFYFNQEGAGWRIDSYGPGIASVKWFAVSVDDIWKSSWKDIADAYKVSEYHFASPGSQIAANTSSSLFLVKPEHSKLLAAFQRVRMEICYCSLLEGCWLSTNKKAEPTKEYQCTNPPKITFVRY